MKRKEKLKTQKSLTSDNIIKDVKFDFLESPRATTTY